MTAENKKPRFKRIRIYSAEEMVGKRAAKRALYKTRSLNRLCVRCGKVAADFSTMCVEHHAERTHLNRGRRQKFIKNRDCIDCGKSLDDTRVTRCSACLMMNKLSAAIFRKRMRPELLIRAKQFRDSIKEEVFKAYGGWICKCCGEIEKEFLSIDHTHGGGNQQRKANKIKNGHSFYCWLKKNGFPEGYQVLCMNCNFAKRYSMVCPHEKEDRFVLTASGKISVSDGVLDVEKAAVALGKICRYAGNCQEFWSVLLHSLIVSDLAPDNIKLLALIHDISETAISDVPSPFKVPQLENIERKIQMRLYESVGLNPTKDDLAQLKIADRRALAGEVWTIGSEGLKELYPNRDFEAENLVWKYSHMFPPEESLQSEGKAVSEFVERFKNLRN